MGLDPLTKISRKKKKKTRPEAHRHSQKRSPYQGGKLLSKKKLSGEGRERKGGIQIAFK